MLVRCWPFDSLRSLRAFDLSNGLLFGGPFDSLRSLRAFDLSNGLLFGGPFDSLRSLRASTCRMVRPA